MMYLIDANVFIEAENRYYSREFCPAFWSWISENSGRIASTKAILEEISKKDDPLSEWAKAQRSSDFFLDDNDDETFKNLEKVTKYIESERQFKPRYRKQFLNGADPFLIAKAISINATIATHEVSAPKSSKVKIPDVCKYFSVSVVQPFWLLKEYNAYFVQQKK